MRDARGKENRVTSNAEIARLLTRIRTLMELSGESFYKFTAYERAATTIENAAPVGELITRGELLTLPGVGKTIGATIEELARTGTAQVLEDLQQHYPPTIFEVLGVPGVGVKTAAMLYEKFNIGSLADLERAIDDGTLAAVPRMGPKSIENLRRGILAQKGRMHRTPLARALDVAAEVMEHLRAGPPLHRLTTAGSLRRAEAMVGDVDIVCTSQHAAGVIAHFTKWHRARAVLGEGPTKASIWLEDGLQIDLRVLPDHLYGNLLQHFTGSREHNIQVREHAVRRGLRVSENGILNLETGDVITCSEEDDVYRALGMQPVPPEMRAGIGEVDLALKNEIPELLRFEDIRGDFHMHTTWSDGRNSLEEMIAAAAERGYQWHAISDHSWGRGRFGLSPEQLREQRAVIASIGEKYGIRTLCSSEVDILPDGTLDYDEAVLGELDVVVASVHSAMNQSREEMTARLIRACENPYVTIIGHPTGRKLDGFEGYDFDHEAVFAAAARTGTAFELDGQENRLDLPAHLVRHAKTFGVKFTTDSDAHDTGQLPRFMALAVSQARRAGLRRNDVLNAMPLSEVLAFIRAKRERP
jgi:DNA polymerase (family X)